MNNFYVYVHRRASDNRPFYVGKGRGYRAHNKRDRSTHWKRIVAKHGYTVKIVQKDLPEQVAFEYEKIMIAHYGRENLCNFTDGGEGMSGFTHSIEARKKIANSRQGKTLSEESRAKISKKNTGRKLSDATKIKMSAALIGTKRALGYRFTDEQRLAVSARLKGNQYTLGHKHSAEVKLAKSIKQKGRPMSLATMQAAIKARSKPVVCSNGMIFPSFSAGARWLRENGYPKASGEKISICVSGHRRTAYGYTWSLGVQ